MNRSDRKTPPVTPVTYRQEIMGAAILLIMFCHSTFYIPHVFLANTYGLLKHMSQAGVDVFLFLSGMGCFRSFRSRPGSMSGAGILAFYKRRLKRILPLYLLIVPVRILIDVLVDGYSISGAVYRYSLFSFFLDGELVTWFIAGLLVLYLLFPLIYYIWEKHGKVFWIFFVLYVAVMCMALWNADARTTWPGLWRLEIFLTRIPVFLCGVCFAGKTSGRSTEYKENIWQKESLHQAEGVGYAEDVDRVESLGSMESGDHVKCLGIAAVSFIYLYVLCLCNEKYNATNMWFVFRLLFLPLAFTIIGSVSLIMDRTKGSRILAHLGKITLELYLLHEWILHISSRIVYSQVEQNLTSSILLNGFAVAAAVLLADGLHLLTERFRKNRRKRAGS